MVNIFKGLRTYGLEPKIPYSNKLLLFKGEEKVNTFLDLQEPIKCTIRIIERITCMYNPAT